jgi:hypothetical protein
VPPNRTLRNHALAEQSRKSEFFSALLVFGSDKQECLSSVYLHGLLNASDAGRCVLEERVPILCLGPRFEVVKGDVGELAAKRGAIYRDMGHTNYYGSDHFHRTFAAPLARAGELDYEPDGLRCEVSFEA